jgi:uroporphyrinogen-III synthase
MKGKRVAVLESRLGEQLADLVAKRGAIPIRAPALAEIPDVDPARISALVEELQQRPAKLAIFQTGVGTRALFKATDELGLTETLLALLSRTKVLARGPKPTGALRQRNVRIDFSAADPFTTREVLQAIGAMPLPGERVVVQRFGAANLELEQALKARGAEVLEIPLYRWSLPEDTAPLEALVGALERGEVDAAVFTNSEQLRNLFAVAARLGRAEALRAALNRTLVASIGPVASAALREAGVRVGLEASPPKLGALVEALDAALSA